MSKGKCFLFGMVAIGLMTCLFSGRVMAQDERAELQDPSTGLWINNYGKFRFTDKLFWIGQFHYRRAESEQVPVVGNMAQIYNRHAINYMFSERFNVSLGGVLRLDYNQNPDPEALEQENMVPEWRIWHEYLFVVPFDRFMVYHRFRMEHRWSRGFNAGDAYFFRNRYRYMFNVKYPINKTSLSPGAIYASPEFELIMQSGRRVVNSPMEELRLIGAIGYIANPRVSYSLGLMYGLGQNLADGSQYRQRLFIRAHMYLSLDIRRVNKRLPEVRLLE